MMVPSFLFILLIGGSIAAPQKRLLIYDPCLENPLSQECYSWTFELGKRDVVYDDPCLFVPYAEGCYKQLLDLNKKKRAALRQVLPICQLYPTACSLIPIIRRDIDVVAGLEICLVAPALCVLETKK